MGFRVGSYAKVWKIEEGNGKSSKVRLSISRKNKQTDEYEQEFSGFCLFIGDAFAKAAALNEGDRIKLGDVDVTSRYDKEKEKEFITYKVFDFEPADGASSSTTTTTSATKKPTKKSTKKSALDENPEDGDTGDLDGNGNLPF